MHALTLSYKKESFGKLIGFLIVAQVFLFFIGTATHFGLFYFCVKAILIIGLLNTWFCVSRIVAEKKNASIWYIVAAVYSVIVSAGFLYFLWVGK